MAKHILEIGQMKKRTIPYRILKANDPLFTGSPQVFVPISRPSTASSTKRTDGEPKKTIEIVVTEEEANLEKQGDRES